jgi:hypothetical protein
MDRLDHRRAVPDGVTCAVCEDRVPAGSIKVLAQRDDLVFIQVDCVACRSTTLAFVIGPGDPAATAVDAPISGNDVLDMHAFLDGWHGGLAELIAR